MLDWFFGSFVGHWALTHLTFEKFVFLFIVAIVVVVMLIEVTTKGLLDWVRGAKAPIGSVE